MRIGLARLSVALLVLALGGCRAAPTTGVAGNDAAMTSASEAAPETDNAIATVDEQPTPLATPTPSAAASPPAEPADQQMKGEADATGMTARPSSGGYHPRSRPYRHSYARQASPPPPPPPPEPQQSADTSIPAFPWPVPRPSAIGRIDRSLMGNARTLGDVDRRLTRALSSIGFDQSGRFTAPDGFVLVTRMERFNDDGRSWTQSGRFSMDQQSALNARDGFSLGDYLRALLYAPQGRYRVLAFVVTDQPVTPGGATMTARDASALVDRGADTLTEPLDATPFSPRHRVVVLIYEFVRPQRGDPSEATPSALQGSDHLRGAGVLQALSH